MMVQRWIFLLGVTLLAAAPSATAALGQTATPGAAQTAAAIPDFSGIWGHPYWPSFEPPASGPGPVTNRSRRLNAPQAGVANPNQLVGDYTNPILKPQAAEVLKRRGQSELNGVGSPTAYNQRWPGGVPFIFFQFWNADAPTA